MSISESQLTTWSNQGAVQASADTHASLREALERHTWPAGMTYSTYLQGSYANATNIRGNSDVDLVVESDAVFYSNLTADEKRARNLSTGAFNFQDLRREVVRALTMYYGSSAITESDKALKVDAAPGRLAADVIPCVHYKEYKNGELYADGMTFWALSGKQIKNFPKSHIANGASKNAAQRTNGWYKPSVRIFKNARERLVAGDAELRKRAPSYFVECLIYNASDSAFGTTFQLTYQAVIEELLSRVKMEPQTLVCQNYKRYLFGDDSTQWNAIDAERFLVALHGLWKKGAG